jgi:peroxiredoxin/predicted 2-oxoglutarate/Fe(II)-dependent dioxygenase YbiX
MHPLLLVDIGDCMPDFRLMDVEGKLMSLYSLALGKPVVILCYPNNSAAAAATVLRGFAEADGGLAERANVFSINGETAEENARFAQGMHWPFPLLADPDHRVLSFFESRRKALAGAEWAEDGAAVCVVADPNRRITRIDQDVRDPGYVQEVARFLDERPRDEPREVGPHAPVLLVPGVFGPELCQRLIRSYDETERPLAPTVSGQRGQMENVANPDLKIRRDHFVSDPTLKAEVQALFAKRVIPEMMKVFDYKATRCEQMRIGCYDARDSGFFRPHRDNVDPSGGRRFAMSVNLNAGEYDGGYLRFPEYGEQLYRPATGDGLIFSSLLLHEATPVTAGRRFVLVTFFRT